MKLNRSILKILLILLLIPAIIFTFNNWNFYFPKKIELDKFNFADRWNLIKKANSIKENTAFISRNNTSGFEMLVHKDSKLYLKYIYLEFTILNNNSTATLNIYRLDEHENNYKLTNKSSIPSKLSEYVPLSIDKLASVLNSININKLIETLKIPDLCLIRYDGIVEKGTTLNSIDKNIIVIDKKNIVDYKVPYLLMENGVKFILSIGSSKNGVSKFKNITLLCLIDELAK